MGSGPAKPGDQARITDVEIKGDFIHFEFNGGPIKKQKWYQRIEIQGAGGSTPVAPSDSNANARGSFVDVYFDKYVPDMTGPELKKVLRPVFDFDAKTPLEAYLETVPPKIKEAIKNHHVLVGMNREMVMYAKGRPPKKLREHADEVDYEEWIYGDPPQDVDFVRFVGEEVARVETMKVGGRERDSHRTGSRSADHGCGLQQAAGAAGECAYAAASGRRHAGRTAGGRDRFDTADRTAAVDGPGWEQVS